jgi:spermidine synthase
MLPPGELPSLGKMLLISLVATGPFCPISGALFGVCWALHRRQEGHPPLGIYLGEALGAAAGGLVYYFIFLPYLSVFTTIWLTSGVMLLISGRWPRPGRPTSRLGGWYWAWLAIAGLMVTGAMCGSRLDQMSRRWLWGGGLLAVHDSPYHNIVVVKKAHQVSVFTNGLWWFSEPGRLSAEHAAHLPLLQHPHPRTILVLGGGVAGLLEELFKHPDLQRVDYVEADPAVVSFLAPHLSPATRASLGHPRLRRFHRDPGAHLRATDTRYDVILMNMGDPITAQMNRFYTREFFALAAQRLLPGGIFSFAVSGGESMLGPSQARFLGALNNTLRRVFPQTLLYPGDQVRFFATDGRGELVADAAILAKRITRRGLRLLHVREDALQVALSPFRRSYLSALVEAAPMANINRDFHPICYLHTLMMWATQWHTALQRFLNLLVGFTLGRLWGLMAMAGLMLLAIFWTGRRKFRLAVGASVFVSGAVEMVVQVVLLLGFQIIAGAVYRQLALIIALFMTGLAVGAGWISHGTPLPAAPQGQHGQGRFIRAQALVCLLPLAAVLLLRLMQGAFGQMLPPAAVGWLFAGFGLMTGIIGGRHFALAVRVMAGTGVAVERIGGGLYALDLAGAAAGALTATLFLIPVYGIINSLIFLSVVSAIGLLALLRPP